MNDSYRPTEEGMRSGCPVTAVSGQGAFKIVKSIRVGVERIPKQWKICTSLKNRNPEEAEKALLAHLDRVKEALLRRNGRKNERNGQNESKRVG